MRVAALIFRYAHLVVLAHKRLEGFRQEKESCVVVQSVHVGVFVADILFLLQKEGNFDVAPGFGRRALEL